MNDFSQTLEELEEIFIMALMPVVKEILRGKLPKDMSLSEATRDLMGKVGVNIIFGRDIVSEAMKGAQK